MDKLRNAKLTVLPYVEIIVKPADVRPIHVIMMDGLNDVDISAGTADDMAELITILGVVRQVAVSLCNVRLFSENHKMGKTVIVSGEDEEPPFEE